MGASGASTLELLGDPTALSQAQARPASMADQRLTDCVHEAPDFSGSNGALTLLSFLLLNCLLFPKTKAEENTEPLDPLVAHGGVSRRTLGITNGLGPLIPACPKAVPFSSKYHLGICCLQTPWILDKRWGPAPGELASALAANQV